MDSPRGGGDAAGARRSLSAAMDVDVGHPATAVATDEGDFELKRFAMEFLSLSHYCRYAILVQDEGFLFSFLFKNRSCAKFRL